MSHRRFPASLQDRELEKFSLDGSVRVQPGFGSSDAFGKFRVSSPHGVFDSKQVGDEDPNAWDPLLVGGGSSISYDSDTSSSTLTVGANAGDRATRQTHTYWPYVPGRSHAITMTGTLGAPVAGVVKRVGYFDDDDGVFFELTGDGTVNLVLRSSTSGSPVETRIPQNEWSLDKMDGVSNHSLAALDLTKSQIFLIDFQWLGVGVIRFGFNIDGVNNYVHEIDNANNVSGVYMKTPTLPVRYEVLNVDGGNTASIEQICCSVVSEGGYENAGFEFTASNGITTRSVTTRTPVLAIRMASAYNGNVNRRLAKLLAQAIYVSSANIYWEIMHYHDPASVTGNFLSAADTSAVEYSADISAITAGQAVHRIDAGYATAGGGTNQGGSRAASTHNTRHTTIARNAQNDNSQYLVVFATAFSGTANVSAVLNWVEFA